MLNKKYQIFISSTFKDLEEERKVVQETILSMYQFPIGMEMFSADDEEQWEIIQETIDSSDYYILIMGYRYGSITSEGISYTEKEYKYAKMKNIPILVFVREDNVPVTQDKIEDNEESKQKLKLFKADAMTGRIIKKWSNKEDLAKEVSLALQKQISRGKRSGWIRADGVNIEETQKELVEMSKKIRRLEEENDELKKQITIRKPEIDVRINYENSKVKIEEYDINSIVESYKRISIEDIPEGYEEMITQEEINEYNKSLPSQEELYKYIRSMKRYNAIKENNINIEIEVENVGTSKANDLRVQLEFPEDLIIYKRRKVEKLKVPKAPEKGVNPIEKLMVKKYNLDAYSQIANSFSSPFLNQFNYDGLGISDIAQIGEDFNDYIEGNTLYVNRNSVIHTRQITIDEKYCVAPIKNGEFNVICKIICEEFEEEVEQVVTITI